MFGTYKYFHRLVLCLERIGPLALFFRYFCYLLFVLLPCQKTTKICLLSIHRDFLLHTTVQHLLLLVGIDTPIYQKYYDTPPILVGHNLHEDCS